MVLLRSLYSDNNFRFCVKDLPRIIKVNSKSVISADDTCIIITSPNPIDYTKKTSNVRIT